tara:strand:- start:948 stop:1790 length:843 start_codon:yes stop_codon:yes gene_type:complete
MHLVINGDEMTIHIYSDSYGQDCDTGWTWPEVLGDLRDETFVNNGLGGTGPNFSMRKLVKDFEDDIIKEKDSIVFLLSDTKRMEFPWLTRVQHQDGLFLLGEDSQVSMNWILGEGVKSLRKYIDKSDVIKEVAQVLGPMFLYENVKNITFLHLLSTMHTKVNFCVLTCFTLNHFTSYFENFNIESTELLKQISFDQLNNNNFHYVTTPVSFMVGRTFGMSHTRDKFPNHMDEEQNKKFAILCNDVLNNREIDTSWFIHQLDVNADDEPKEISKMNVFIYE